MFVDLINKNYVSLDEIQLDVNESFRKIWDIMSDIRNEINKNKYSIETGNEIVIQLLRQWRLLMYDYIKYIRETVPDGEDIIEDKNKLIDNIYLLIRATSYIHNMLRRDELF